MLIIHAIATLDPAAGGPPRTSLGLASAQAELGHEVHMVAYRGPSGERVGLESDAGAGRPDSAGQVVMHELPLPRAGERFLARAVRAVFRELLPRADVLHLHGVWESIIRTGAAEARRLGKPYVVAPHGMLDRWSLAQRKWKKRIALALGYRSMLEGAAFIHGLNTDEVRLLAPLHLTCPVRIIPNGVFPEPFASLPPKGTFRRSQPELADAPFVLFLSRLHYKKGLDHLARAFELLADKVPDLRLVVAGPDDGARADFEARVARAGLTGRTHVVGPLYGTAKLAALVDAAAFCLPSRQEGLSVAILEAMACGTPVVISESCHFPEVGEAGAGLAVPLDAEAVARALLRVLSEPGEAARMGQAGRKLTFERYLWSEIAELSIDAYGIAPHS